MIGVELSEMNYEEMLDRAYSLLPKEALAKERFELPKAEVMVEANKTFVKNYSQIMKAMNREEKHLLKFFTKEVATAIQVDGNRLILNRKFSEKQINDLFQNYFKEFVSCKVCGRPDTKITDQQGVKMIKCTACGAINPMKKI